MNILLVLLISAGPFLSLTWTTKTPMPQARAGCGCAAIADTIFVVGGRDSAGNRFAENHVYVPTSDSWTTRASMPTARAHLGAAYVNGKIYAIGGWTGSTTGACEEYDPVSDTWQSRASMPTPRYTLAIAAVAGKIYVFGGMNSSGQVFNTVEEYDPVGNSWSAKTSMPTARFGPACAVVRDTVYVYGGSTYVGGGLTAVNEYYVPANDTWGAKASLSSGRYCATGFVYQNKAFSLGGYDYYNYLTYCHVYDPATNAWTTETPMQNSRQSLATAVVGNCVYAIAGWNNGALNYTEEGMFTTGIEEQDANALAGLSIKVSPNPFRDRTVIRFSGKGAESAINEGSFKIYNATGCLVNSFALYSSFIPHPLSFSWSGTDQTGRELPGGVYLLVAEYNGARQSQKLIIAR
jgi:N-acetylneuraminic acid mutarotase